MADQKKKERPNPVDPVVQIMLDAGKQDQYKETVQYLMSQRALPPVVQRYLGESTLGEFARNTIFGNELPQTGQIRLNYGAGPGTLAHEMTHAAQSQLSNQYIEESNAASRSDRFAVIPKDTPFMDTYRKLRYDSNMPTFESRDRIQELIAKLAPEWARKNSDYRSTSNEAQAFAIGNTMAPEGMRPFSPAPLHVDSTLATEFLILLDAAKRSNDKKPVTDKR